MTCVDGPGQGIAEVTVTELAMDSPTLVRPGREPDVTAQLIRVEEPSPELARFFYRSVGGPWYWVDRLDWTYEQWSEWTHAPGHEMWTCWVKGAPAGYFELDRQGDVVEIAYFGLLRDFIGMGLGGWLLTQALKRAWEVPGTARVWVHTCTLDGPSALASYVARGFSAERTYIEYRDVSEPPPGPWRGSGLLD